MNNALWLVLAMTLSTSLAALSARAQEAPAAAATNPPAPAAKPKPAPKAKPAPASKPAAAHPAPALKPGPAVTTQRNTNVRGQPAIHSEVVTRLTQGQHVTVLELITLAKPQEDEPAHWAKIALPTGAFVWVHTDFIDAASKTVKPNRLNLRSGPGENFSILGRIEKGATVKEVETKGDWIKIEPPAGTYAFVAAHLLTNAPTETTLAAVPPPPTTPETPLPPPTVVPTAEPVVPPPLEVRPAEPATPATPTNEVPRVGEVKTESAPPPVPEPPPQPEIVPRRIVSREGFVRNTVSIQAPTHFKLESLDTRKTVNYIFSPTTNIFLRDFFGKRIIVTGEEVLDERWPNTPVINVESIRTVE